MEARVAQIIDGRKLVLNKGSEDGVRVGQRFLIYATGEEIRDPETNEPLEELEIIRGTGKVVHSQNHICTIATDMKAPPHRIVRKKRHSPLSNITAVALAFGGSEEIEELLPSEESPFEDPEVNDYARSV